MDAPPGPSARRHRPAGSVSTPNFSGRVRDEILSPILARRETMKLCDADETARRTAAQLGGNATDVRGAVVRTADGAATAISGDPR